MDAAQESLSFGRRCGEPGGRAAERGSGWGLRSAQTSRGLLGRASQRGSGGVGMKEPLSRTYVTELESHGLWTVPGRRLSLPDYGVELGFKLSGDQQPVRREPIDPVWNGAARGR